MTEHLVCRGCGRDLKPGCDRRDGMCSGASHSGNGPWCYGSFTDFARHRRNMDPRHLVDADGNHEIDWTQQPTLVAFDEWLNLGRPETQPPPIAEIPF